MNNENKDFMIDVVKQRTYQNQNERYSKEYSRWRSDTSNPYAYKFIHDTREHSYVDGEGFLNKTADVSERNALSKCLGLLGLVMLVMFFIALANNFILYIFIPNSDGNLIYVSEKDTFDQNLTHWYAVFFLVLTVAKYLIPAVIFLIVTRIPINVALPNSKNDPMITVASVIIMLMVMVLGRICIYLLSGFFSFVGLDSVYAYMMYSDDAFIRVISIATNCLVMPVLCEVFFRGIVLQTFRQFGDFFAIFVSAIACAMSFYDISHMLHAACLSIILGLFTVRTGSVFTPILMHMTSTSFDYFLAVLSLHRSSTGLITEVLVCTVITGLSIIAFTKLTANGDWNFNISNDSSNIDFTKKVKIFLTTNSVAIWLVFSVIMAFARMRFL